MVGMLFGARSFNRVFSCGWGQGWDSCSVCLCLKYGPLALKAGFVSTDGLYGVPWAAPLVSELPWVCRVYITAMAQPLALALDVPETTGDEE